MKNKMRILVLDDEPIVCERLQATLEKLGFHVETFTNSKAAINRLAEFRFDIVVTDLKMSGPDGMDILRFVQENSPRSKVIIITGFATVEKAEEAMRSGAVDFVAKPFKITELRDLVLRIAREMQNGVTTPESQQEDTP